MAHVKADWNCRATRRYDIYVYDADFHRTLSTLFAVGFMKLPHQFSVLAGLRELY